MVSAKELKQVSVQYNNSGSISSVNRHVLRLVLKLNTFGWVTPGPGSYDPGFSTTYVHDRGNAGTPPTTAYSTTLAGTSNDDAASVGSFRAGGTDTTTTRIIVDSPGMVEGSGWTASSGGYSGTGLYRTAAANDTFTCDLVSTGTLSGSYFDVRIRYQRYKYELIAYRQVLDGSSNYVETRYDWRYTPECREAIVRVDIGKIACYYSSIDTRMLYGQPNIDGILPGNDPNAEQRNLNFYPWIYRGGLFVGRGPTSKDQSGVARIQLYPESTFGSHNFAVVAMYDLGAPASSGTLKLEASVPSKSDSHISTAYTGVTWATRWLRDTVTRGADAFSVELSSATNDYVTWRLPVNSEVGSASPLPAKIIIARDVSLYEPEDEDEYVGYEDGLGYAWRYFLSRDYQSAASALPFTDGAARVWTIDCNFQSAADGGTWW